MQAGHHARRTPDSASLVQQTKQALLQLFASNISTERPSGPGTLRGLDTTILRQTDTRRLAPTHAGERGFANANIGKKPFRTTLPHNERGKCSVFGRFRPDLVSRRRYAERTFRSAPHIRDIRIAEPKLRDAWLFQFQFAADALDFGIEFGQHAVVVGHGGKRRLHTEIELDFGLRT